MPTRGRWIDGNPKLMARNIYGHVMPLDDEAGPKQRSESFSFYPAAWGCRRKTSSANQSTVIGVYRPSLQHKNTHKICARKSERKAKHSPIGSSALMALLADRTETRQWCGRKTKGNVKKNSKILISFCVGFRFRHPDSGTSCKSISNFMLFIVQLLINIHGHRSMKKECVCDKHVTIRTRITGWMVSSFFVVVFEHFGVLFMRSPLRNYVFHRRDICTQCPMVLAFGCSIRKSILREWRTNTTSSNLIESLSSHEIANAALKFASLPISKIPKSLITSVAVGPWVFESVTASV